MFYRNSLRLWHSGFLPFLRWKSRIYSSTLLSSLSRETFRHLFKGSLTLAVTTSPISLLLNLPACFEILIPRISQSAACIGWLARPYDCTTTMTSDTSFFSSHFLLPPLLFHRFTVSHSFTSCRTRAPTSGPYLCVVASSLSSYAHSIRFSVLPLWHSFHI